MESSLFGILLTTIILSVTATFKLWIASEGRRLFKALMTILVWGIPVFGALLVIHFTPPLGQKPVRERASVSFAIAVIRFGTVLGTLSIILGLAVTVLVPLSYIAFGEPGVLIGPALDLLVLPLGYALSWAGNFLIFNYWLLKQVNTLNVRDSTYENATEAEDSRKTGTTLTTTVMSFSEIGKFLFFSQARLLTVMAYINSAQLIVSSRSYERDTIYNGIAIDLTLLVFLEGLFVLLVGASMHSMLATYRRVRQLARQVGEA